MEAAPTRTCLDDILRYLAGCGRQWTREDTPEYIIIKTKMVHRYYDRNGKWIRWEQVKL